MDKVLGRPTSPIIQDRPRTAPAAPRQPPLTTRHPPAGFRVRRRAGPSAFSRLALERIPPTGSSGHRGTPDHQAIIPGRPQPGVPPTHLHATTGIEPASPGSDRHACRRAQRYYPGPFQAVTRRRLPLPAPIGSTHPAGDPESTPIGGAELPSPARNISPGVRGQIGPPSSSKGVCDDHATVRGVHRSNPHHPDRTHHHRARDPGGGP